MSSESVRPVGCPVPGWTTRPPPPRTPMSGRFCRVEPVDIERDAAELFAANRFDADGLNWTYLAVDAPPTLDAYVAWLRRMTGSDDPVLHVIVDLATSKPVGVAAYMRIDRANGTIEVGNINYSPLLQRKPAATEAMYLMMARVFEELGYRRYEWKCDSFNAPSRAAAQRLGFQYEGIFRQAVVTKGRNRDTAWFSIIDSEWPALKAAYQRWLAPENFGSDGRQRQSLNTLIRAVR